MSRVGKQIQTARERAGFSSKELAKKLGVAENFISDIENGRKIINEDLIKRIEKILGASLSDDVFEEITEPLENIKEVDSSKTVNKQWEDAFSHIIKKIPVCDVSFKEIFEYKYIPVMDKKIDGYNAEKITYVKVPDDSMRGFRIQKDDKVMLYLNPEIVNNGILLIESDGKRCLRQIKRLDSNKVLVISQSSELKTETRDAKSFIVIGRCLKLEVEF
jgi:transcriptional regulator with XRE-family HTH domain